MSAKRFFKLILILIGLTPELITGQKIFNHHPIVTTGRSQINITPAEPVIMSGYDGRKTPLTGIHDSFFASALYFSGEQNKTLLITADMIGFPFAFVHSLREMISLKTDVHLIILCSP